MAITQEVVLDVNTKTGVQAMKEYRKEMQELKGQLLTLDADSQEYADTMQEIANRMRDMSDMSAEMRNSAMDLGQVLGNVGKIGGGLAGSFGAVQGAMQLMGVESKSLDKVFIALQSTMAIANGLNGLDGMIKSFKMLTIGLKNATLAQLGLNKAMLANPITLIIIAITTLVAIYNSAIKVMEIFNKKQEAQNLATDIQIEKTNKLGESVEKTAKLFSGDLAESFKSWDKFLNSKTELTAIYEEFEKFNYQLIDTRNELKDLEASMSWWSSLNAPLAIVNKKMVDDVNDMKYGVIELEGKLIALSNSFNQNSISGEEFNSKLKSLTNDMGLFFLNSGYIVKNIETGMLEPISSLPDNIKEPLNQWIKLLDGKFTQASKIALKYAESIDVINSKFEDLILSDDKKIVTKYEKYYKELDDLQKIDTKNFAKYSEYRVLLQKKEKQELSDLAKSAIKDAQAKRKEELKSIEDFYGKVSKIATESITDERFRLLSINEDEKDKELQELKNSYETVKEINKNNSEELLKIEEQYQKSKTLVIEKYANKSIKINNDANDKFDADEKARKEKRLQDEIELINKINNVKLKGELKPLQEGESNIAKDLESPMSALITNEEIINRKRQELQMSFEMKRLEIIRDALNQELKMRQELGLETSAVELELAQNSLDISVANNDAKIYEQQKVSEAVMQSIAQASESLGVISSAFQDKAQEKNEQFLSAKESLNKAIESGDQEAIAREKKRVTELDKEQKKSFKLYKAFAISQAIMDTISSANSAYKSMVGIPIVGPVLGPIAAGTAVAAGMLNVAKIKKQQLNGGSDITADTSSNTPNINAVQPNIQVSKNFLTNEELELQKESNRVYVVENDIRQVGKRVDVVTEESTF